MAQEKKDVVVFVGTNGAGKTTLIDYLVRRTPGSTAFNGADLLIDHLGISSRAELAAIPLEERFKKREEAVLLAISRTDAAPIFLDYHMLLADPDGRFRTTWSSRFLPHVRSAYFILGDPNEIHQRRVHDAEIKGKRRSTDTQVASAIQEAQLAELRLFNKVFLGERDIRMRVVYNKDGRFDDVAETIRTDLPYSMVDGLWRPEPSPAILRVL